MVSRASPRTPPRACLALASWRRCPWGLWSLDHLSPSPYLQGKSGLPGQTGPEGLGGQQGSSGTQGRPIQGPVVGALPCPTPVLALLRPSALPFFSLFPAALSISAPAPRDHQGSKERRVTLDSQAYRYGGSRRGLPWQPPLCFSRASLDTRAPRKSGPPGTQGTGDKRLWVGLGKAFLSQPHLAPRGLIGSRDRSAAAPSPDPVSPGRDSQGPSWLTLRARGSWWL